MSSIPCSFPCVLASLCGLSYSLSYPFGGSYQVKCFLSLRQVLPFFGISLYQVFSAAGV